jgi:hypothetical protein
MKIVIFMLLLLPLLAQAQLDTVRVYKGLDISFLTRNDTVMLSLRKWNNVIETMRSSKIMLDKQIEISDKYSISISLANDQISECVNMSKTYEERSIMYKGAYEMTVDRIKEMNGLLQSSILYSETSRKRNIWQGVAFGSIGGLLIGVVTAAILLQ